MNGVFLDDFTMVIPTYNRPTMLARALRNYAAGPVRFKVVVADSSPEPVQEQNKAVVDDLPDYIEHVRYPSTTTVYAKFSGLASLVDTTYGMLTADDDITIVDGVVAALDFLRGDPDFVACHGTYYNAALTPDNLTLRVGIEYSVASHDADEPVGRLMSLAMRYQSLAYCVQRREAMRSASPPASVATDHFWELYNGFRLLIAGKVKGLSVPFAVRNAQLGSRPDFFGDPNNWLLHDSAAMSAGYTAFVTALAPALADRPPRSAESILALVYSVYFARSLRYSTIFSRLEGEGVTAPGSTSALLALSALSIHAPAIGPDVAQLLANFASAGWPHFN